MSRQDSGYHVGYEMTKTYQAEVREARAQDRTALQIRVAQPDGPNRHLIAHPRRGLWAVIQRRALGRYPATRGGEHVQDATADAQ